MGHYGVVGFGVSKLPSLSTVGARVFGSPGLFVKSQTFNHHTNEASSVQLPFPTPSPKTLTLPSKFFSFYISIYLFIYLSIYLSIYIYIYIYICLLGPLDAGHPVLRAHIALLGCRRGSQKRQKRRLLSAGVELLC